jgi:hypothetical protein
VPILVSPVSLPICVLNQPSALPFLRPFFKEKTKELSKKA